jgi:hypothetical protein
VAGGVYLFVGVRKGAVPVGAHAGACQWGGGSLMGEVGQHDIGAGYAWEQCRARLTGWFGLKEIQIFDLEIDLEFDFGRI